MYTEKRRTGGTCATIILVGVGPQFVGFFDLLVIFGAPVPLFLMLCLAISEACFLLSKCDILAICCQMEDLATFEEILLRGLKWIQSRCACLQVAFIGSSDAILFCAAEPVNKHTYHY
jgi:hypothetical protein